MRACRRPGAHARHAQRRAGAQAAGLIALAAIAAVCFVLPPGGQQSSPLWLAVAFALLALGALRSRAAARWRIGRRSERIVARRLRRLRHRGWVIVHDVDRGRGNIDHLVIGPRGVFAIETKTTRHDGHAIAQAAANAAWAARRLGVPVTPVLCVVARRQRPRVMADVVCVDVRRLRRALRRHSNLAAVDAQALAQRLGR